MLVRLLHSANDESPMRVTLPGIVTLVRPLQRQNAESPMLVTLSGIVMPVRLLLPANACSAIAFVPFLMLYAPERASRVSTR